MQQKIRHVIQSQDICVLATSRHNVPHTSLMAYVASEDCTTFFMATYRNTRKFANILSNSEVSLLLDNRNENTPRNRLDFQSLTIHGKAEILQNPDKITHAERLLHQKHPHLHDFLAGEGIAFIAIKAADFLLLEGPVSAVYEAL